MQLDRGSIAVRGAALGLAWAVMTAGLATMPQPAAAQLVAASTVLAAKAALESAINGFRQALSQLAGDLQSLGNSLQANAQNVLADFDRILGENIHLVFEELEAAQRRFVEDAQALTGQLQAATQAIVVGTAEEARRTIVDADIAAYNASYSLPCRSAVPRVLASFPARVTADGTLPLLRVRGNFLRQGEPLAAAVNGVDARIVERLDTQVSVQIPPEVSEQARNAEVAAAVTIAGLDEIRRSPRFWGLLGCGESVDKVAIEPIALTVLEPPMTIGVAVTVWPAYTLTREVLDQRQPFSETDNDVCEGNFRVDRQYCLSGRGKLARAEVTNVRANCSSAYNGWVPSGDRCVLVRGKVHSCGARRAPVSKAWLECKGRGWLKYDVALYRAEPYSANGAARKYSAAGASGQRAFSFPLPDAPAGATGVSHRYVAKVERRRGARLVDAFEMSEANPNAGPFVTRTAGSALAVEIVGAP